MNSWGLTDVNIFLVLYYDPQGPIWTNFDPSEPNLALQTPLKPSKLGDTLNLPVVKKHSEVLNNLSHHFGHTNLDFDCFITLNYNLNTTGTNHNPLEPFSSK